MRPWKFVRSGVRAFGRVRLRVCTCTHARDPRACMHARVLSSFSARSRVRACARARVRARTRSRSRARTQCRPSAVAVDYRVAILRHGRSTVTVDAPSSCSRRRAGSPGRTDPVLPSGLSRSRRYAVHAPRVTVMQSLVLARRSLAAHDPCAGGMQRLRRASLITRMSCAWDSMRNTHRDIHRIHRCGRGSQRWRDHGGTYTWHLPISKDR
jgi:hypothetical protein